MIVELDSSIYSDHLVEWTCFRSAEPTDGFEITRPVPMNVLSHTVHLKMLRNYSPERFSVSTALMTLTHSFMKDRTDDTRQNIVGYVWQYIKHHDLVHKSDVRLVVADDRMEQVFGQKHFQFKELLSFVTPHLQPLQGPTDLSYVIPACDPTGSAEDGNRLLGEKLFDVEIDTQETIDLERAAFLEAAVEAQQECGQELRLCNEQCLDWLAHVNQLGQECEWLKQFSEDPVTFIRDIVTSQSADLQILQSDFATEAAPQNKGTYFQQSWVKDAIGTLWNAAT